MSHLINSKQVCTEYEPHFVFCNTGLEHEDTLRFVNEVDKKLLDNKVVWLEAVVNPEKGKGIRHKFVTYETASRKGEPYEAVMQKYQVPGMTTPICTDRLKTTVITSYLRETFKTTKITRALGIRADETRRAKEKALVIYPLVDLDIDKQDVLEFCAQFEWDLRIPEHLGNCVTCFKKSDRKLVQAYNDAPEYFHILNDMILRKGEEAHPFRKYRSVIDIINLAKEVGDTSNLPNLDGGCSESCEFMETM